MDLFLRICGFASGLSAGTLAPTDRLRRFFQNCLCNSVLSVARQTFSLWFTHPVFQRDKKAAISAAQRVIINWKRNTS
jgi:hypothetical protein